MFYLISHIQMWEIIYLSNVGVGLWYLQENNSGSPEQTKRHGVFNFNLLTA